MSYEYRGYTIEGMDKTIEQIHREADIIRARMEGA
jgi:hypothetical protein